MQKPLHQPTHTAALLVAALLAASALNPTTAQTPPAAATAEQTRAEITTLLNDFLKPGNNDKAETHERFWADDLVYTSAAGIVRSKADILKSFKDAKPADAKAASATTAAKAPATVFTAEDILVRPYGANGDVAALTFRLVATEVDGKKSYYRNSGTFLLRGGKWQAVTWQATKV